LIQAGGAAGLIKQAAGLMNGLMQVVDLYRKKGVFPFIKPLIQLSGIQKLQLCCGVVLHAIKCIFYAALQQNRTQEGDH